MRFIIANTTATAINNQVADVLVECGLDKDTAITATTMQEVTEFKNFSITQQGDEWVYEIDDQVLLKYMRMYVRIAKIIVPFIEPVKRLFSTIKEDMDDIQAFIAQRKE